MAAREGVAAALIATLGACTAEEAVDRDDLPFEPVYKGIETQLLGDDLVGFIVEMEGARDAIDVEDYATCAVAQYTLIRGYGFARHVRTRVALESGVWRADAVYTVSPALPQGSQTIDAEVTVEDCALRGIPTV
ncbi:hypothetical protein [Aliiruegeria lutimaris]|uniref:Lipoprotein n=1 Tax=Aliiruegeria lutimaris TaxID=571298 RepID=A0A1G8J4F1_9RHOB|nr:hypothetical protein SAMN04488026_1001218 [Aliiruegeria lutimaris]